MMYLRYFILVVFATILGVYNSFGKVDKQMVKHAINVLKDIDNDKTKEWAITILEESVRDDSSAYVMNCLGLAYMAGVGVEQDSTKAIMLLENAGRKGYADSYHNLGIMFKESECGIRQNFEKAYKYFSIGADSGSVFCKYDKGFMLYKGLGCAQNYSEALENFLSAAEYKHAPALYMLGLCYRNGFGVHKDTVKASNYLNYSASLGYRDAYEELARPYEETYLHQQLSNNDYSSNIPVKMPDVSTEINDLNLINGSYHGYLIIYDWSGNYIIGEKPLSMTAERNGNTVYGAMVIGVDTVPFDAEITSDSKLVFKKGDLMLNERYINSGKVKYRMENMNFNVWDDKIIGSLNLYSLKLKEPDRPMYFELYRNNVDNIVENRKFDNVIVSPNPFEFNFDASFELQYDTDIKVRMFNIYGMMVWQKSLGNLSKGKHTITLSPNIKSGKYVLNIKAGENTLHTIIIKK